MTLQATSALFVTGVGYAATASGPKLNLSVTPCPGLYIGSISISRGPVPISGTIFQGSPTRAGRVLVSVDATTFSELYAQAVMPCRVSLSYDSLSFEILQIEILRGISTAALELPNQLVGATHETFPQVAGQDEAAAE